jgi:hypothetical protein
MAKSAGVRQDEVTVLMRKATSLGFGALALTALALAAIVGGCGGGPGTVTGGSQQIGSAGGGATASQITIPAQTLPVIAADGTTTPLSVSTPEIKVSPGQTFTLKVQISDRRGVTGVGLTAQGPDASLTCLDAVLGDVIPPSDNTLTEKNAAAGAVTVAAIAPTGATASGGGTIATLTLKLTGTGSAQPVALSGEVTGAISGWFGANPHKPTAGQVRVATISTGIGDVVGLGYPSLQAAVRILRAYAGVEPAPAGEEVYYDANGDGIIDLPDPIKVLRRYAYVDTGPWPIVLNASVSVTGLVKDSVSGLYVSGASVVVAGGATATTNASGRFTSPNQVASGLSSVAVTRSGYTALNLPGVRIATDITPSDIGTLTITPNTVSGTLYMPDGITKDGGVSIECSINSTTTVVTTTGAAGGATAGQFTFRGIPFGNQVIIVRDQPNPSDPLNPLTAYKAITIPTGGSLTGISVVLSAGPPGPPLPF